MEVDENGIAVGHYTDLGAATGCTVVLCPGGASGGVAVRGGAPCTRETDIFNTGAGVDPRRVHGVLLTGGSVFGLAAADGVVQFLSAAGIGLQTADACIPILAAAGIYDLGIGEGGVRPDAAAGLAACRAAGAQAPAEGSVGVGSGATVGKARGMDRCTKAGFGIATRQLRGGALVRAFAVVNALGEVVDPASGAVVAGVRGGAGIFEPTDELLADMMGLVVPLSNTALAVVVTNAALNREDACGLASAAHDGFARTIRPAHTRVDGDVIFALATGAPVGGGMPMLDLIALQSAAATAVADAVLRGVRCANGVAGVPSASEWANAG